MVGGRRGGREVWLGYFDDEEAAAEAIAQFRRGHPSQFRDMSGPTLLCLGCGETKDASEFYDSAYSRKDGSRLKAPRCKTCCRGAQRANYRRRAEHHKRVAAAWRERNAELARSYARNRKARLREVWVENVNRQTVYEIHGGRCGICGQFIAGTFDVDHIVPLSRGGVHSYANTQPAHPACNQRKRAWLPDELDELLAA